MAPERNKRLAEGFYRLSRAERDARLVEREVLDAHDIALLHQDGALSFQQANQWIENAMGAFPLPLGIAFHLVVDREEYVVPMAIEETSVIAALSSAAKWIKQKGEITTQQMDSLGIGQIQIPKVTNLPHIRHVIEIHKEALLEELNQKVVPNLCKRGGGAREMQVREIARPDGHMMVVIHLLVETCDAMGANLINQLCEYLKSPLEELLNEKVGLCVVSNLSDTKRVQARAIIRNIDPELGQAITEASLFAQLDPYRAATNNKGVLNGIDALLIATGNDWRAVGAGLHAYAARSGQYRSITQWSMQNGCLHGVIETPLSVGIVGGVTRLHPVVQISLKMLRVKSASELARLVAAVGLVQNLAALKALATEGINKGHMKLHVGNLALAAGASTEELPLLKQRLAEHWDTHKRLTESDAKVILSGLRKSEEV